MQTVTEAAQQTTKLIQEAKPIASSTVETISTAEPTVIVGTAGALFVAYLLFPPIWSVISFSLRGYKGKLSVFWHGMALFCGCSWKQLEMGKERMISFQIWDVIVKANMIRWYWKFWNSGSKILLHIQELEDLRVLSYVIAFHRFPLSLWANVLCFPTLQVSLPLPKPLI